MNLLNNCTKSDLFLVDSEDESFGFQDSFLLSRHNDLVLVHGMWRNNNLDSSPLRQLADRLIIGTRNEWMVDLRDW